MTNKGIDSGVLTTHVLDTSRGCPAEGIKIGLFRITADYDFIQIGDGETDSDGRLTKPLLSGEDFSEGTYQLVFHATDYLKVHFKKQVDNLFLGDIPIRFKISNATEHYHVPLLLSPFGYSTYRGS
jgi:5-hydroxyisourate hydrolase